MFGRTRCAVQAALAATMLCDELKSFIASLVARTGLRRTEQLDIAAELASHFCEGLATGKSVEALIASYGDVQQSARELRASAIAKRGSLDRAAGTLVKCTSIGVAALLVVYLGSASVVYFREPVISFDATAALQARLPKPGAEGRALELYITALGDADGRYRGEWFATGIAAAEDALARADTDAGAEAELRRALGELHGAIETLRSARTRPVFGVSIGADLLRDQAAVRFFGRDVLAGAGDASAGPLSGSAMAIVLPQLSLLKMCAKALCLDARLAALDGRSEDFIRSVDAASMVAVHAGELQVLISGLVKLGIQGALVDTVRAAVERSGAAFSEAQLAELEAIVRSQRVDLATGLEGDYLMMRDVIQRCFSDDGHGDGVLLPRAWGRMLVELQSWSGPTAVAGAGLRPTTAPAFDFLAGPLTAVAFPSRRESEASIRLYFDRAVAAVSAPKREELEARKRELEALEVRGGAPFMSVADLLMPSLSRTVDKPEKLRVAVDETLSAIADERSRRAGAANAPR